MLRTAMEGEVTVDDPILRRRSIRKYTQQPVTEEQVEALLRAGMAAPSAGNQQPWRFVVIRDKDTLRAITDFHPYAAMLPGAPVAVLICGDPRGIKWPDFWDQDCAAAAENMLIAAERLGLGSVWLGIHPLRERVEGVRGLLGIPDEIVPFALLPFGHPAEHKPPAERYDPELVRLERW